MRNEVKTLVTPGLGFEKGKKETEKEKRGLLTREGGELIPPSSSLEIDGERGGNLPGDHINQNQ